MKNYICPNCKNELDCQILYDEEGVEGLVCPNCSFYCYTSDYEEKYKYAIEHNKAIRASKKLRPCPKCGKNAHIYKASNQYVVVCDTCNIKNVEGMMAEKIITSPLYDTMEEAVRAWNRKDSSKH